MTDTTKAAPNSGAGKFPLGRLVATPGALALVQGRRINIFALIERHVLGDWGDLHEEDKQENENALKEGRRLMSAYVVDKSSDNIAGFGEEGYEGEKVWVITEWDRSVTTVLLPSEY